MALEPTIAREELVEPLGEDSPCGEDLRYDGLYDSLNEARREDEDIPEGDWKREGKKADWDTVMRLAEAALRERTKDLHVTARLTEGLLHRYGLRGLLDGLWVMRTLTTRFWDHVHPEIEDGDDFDLRAGPFQWANGNLAKALYKIPLTVPWGEPKRPSGASLQDYLESERVEEIARQDYEAAQEEIRAGKFDRGMFQQVLEETPYDTWREHLEAIEGCWEEFRGLYDVCAAKFGNDVPNLSDLRQAIEKVKELVEDVERQRRPAEEPAEGEYAEATEAAAKPDPVRAVLRAAETLFRNEPENPISFLVARSAAWGPHVCRAAPPDLWSVDPPLSETRQLLKQLWNDGQYQELLSRSEEAFRKPEGRVWMDLQRYSAQALESLGGDFVYCAEAIKFQVGWFLRAFPDFHRQTFPDDSPLANAESVTWLDEVLQAFGARPDTEEVAEVEEAPREPLLVGMDGTAGLALENEELVRAREAMQDGRVDEAIGILIEQSRTSATGRERFQAKLLMAEGFLIGRRAIPALKTFEELAKQVDHYHLEDWESIKDCSRVWTGLYQSLDLVEMDDTQRSTRKSEAYGRVFRLDPETALELEG